MQRRGIDEGAAATDEPHAVGLTGGGHGGIRRRGQQVKHPRRELALRTRPALAQDRIVIADDLGFDEELGKGRMRRIGGRRRKHDLRITRDIERPRLPGSVGDDNPPHLEVVLRRNRDQGAHVDPVIATVEYRAPVRKDRFQGVRARERRLVSG